VTGIDIEDSQFAGASEQAEREGLNVTFRKASVYELPFEAGTFDWVFSHALLEDLRDPGTALVEFRRVLKPGGLIGVKAEDAGGKLIDAASDGPAQAFGTLRTRRAIPKILTWAANSGGCCGKPGFAVDGMMASYDVITDILVKIGPPLASTSPRKPSVI
jgi:ubiquinone/menaquinone biosynthesis C-methylase UbiE